MLRGLKLAALLLVLSVLAAEALLQLGALLVRDRSGSWRPGAQVRVLAVGDSHTYGAGLAAEDSYPARLQAILDEDAPGRYSVINLGIPGLNSAQVRNRLPLQVSRYRPDVVLVWCGSNNAWNRTDVEDRVRGWRARADAWAQRSRLYRLLRVRLYDRELERASVPTRAEGVRQDAERRVDVSDREMLTFEDDGENVTYEGEPRVATWSLRHDGVEERIEVHHGPRRYDDVVRRRAAEDDRAIADWLRGAGVAMVLIAYPMEIRSFHLANLAAREVAAEKGIPLVEASASLERVPPEQQGWLPGAHPNAALYRELARDVAALLERLDL